MLQEADEQEYEEENYDAYVNADTRKINKDDDNIITSIKEDQR